MNPRPNKITFETYKPITARRPYNLEEDRALKEEIQKVSKSIRRKYRALKLGRAEEDETVNRLLKPVIDPLQELKAINIKNLATKKSIDGDIKISTAQLKPIEEEEPMLEDTYEATSTINLNEFIKKYPPLARSYIKGLYNRSREYDETYGVRFSPEMNKLYVGNMELYIGSSAGIIVDDKIYAGKRGLYELLFMKNPEDYDEQDLGDYKEILETSSGHKRNYDSSSQFNGTRSSKYKHIIKPLFKRGGGVGRRMKSTQSHSGSGTSPNHMIYNENTIEYIYWDDVNELVERLKLLNASKAAGNTDSHNNEILAIINELREARIIY